jgi:hypothetical protein
MATLLFTPLERAALEEVCRQQGPEQAVLEHQLSTARVTERRNSGAGFFTELSVDRGTAPVTNAQRVLGKVAASIEGFEQPLLLMLFMENGYAKMLEGATVTDSTIGIDFSSVRFKISSHS